MKPETRETAELVLACIGLALAGGFGVWLIARLAASF